MRVEERVGPAGSPGRARPERVDPSTNSHWEVAMPKYLLEAAFSLQGVKGIQSEGGTSRRDAVTKAVEGLGGRVECFYFAFGDRDVYVVADLPDNETATALALTVNSSGAVTVKTVVLVTPEEVDAAVKQSVSYRPPGG
jgi:uncharacterized protein with GYD domain